MKYDLPDELIVDVDGPIRIVTMNRPEQYNCVNAPLHDGLASVWSQLASDPDARVVILTGAGPAFSAGGDIAMFEASLDQTIEQRHAQLRQSRNLVWELIGFPLPVIAAVNGPAVGLGASLATFADIVLMAESAYLADPHVTMGLVAGDGGAVTWPLMTSLLKVKEYLFTGDKISASEAERIGLANYVVPDGELMERATTLARRLGEQPVFALRETKRALNIHMERATTGVLDFSLAAESESFTTEDHRSRVRSFLARRGASRA